MVDILVALTVRIFPTWHNSFGFVHTSLKLTYEYVALAALSRRHWTALFEDADSTVLQAAACTSLSFSDFLAICIEDGLLMTSRNTAVYRYHRVSATSLLLSGIS